MDRNESQMDQNGYKLINMDTNSLRKSVHKQKEKR